MTSHDMPILRPQKVATVLKHLYLLISIHKTLGCFVSWWKDVTLNHLYRIQELIIKYFELNKILKIQHIIKSPDNMNSILLK